ncbi:MAG: RecX family transcriptional regulator [Armatimonadetes bacterium]|nr:RecX family transcriptional regulator [Armatimonadota bacterium]
MRTNSARPELVWVYLDGEKAARVTATDVVELGLQRGLELGQEQEEEVMRRAEIVEVREAALRLLARRSRSRTELWRRLKTRKFSKSTIEVVLDELEGLGYVDDREHARAWAQQALKSGRAGPAAIRAKLRQQGIASEIVREAVDEALEGTDEEEIALRLGEKRLRSLEGLDIRTRQRRLYSYLARRGFSHEVIRNVVTSLIPADE